MVTPMEVAERVFMGIGRKNEELRTTIRKAWWFHKYFKPSVKWCGVVLAAWGSVSLLLLVV